MKKLGRVGVKALLYFEVVTTAALLIGLVIVTIVQPGAGINADPATLDAKAVAQYTTSGEELSTVDFIMNIIPDQTGERLRQRRSPADPVDRDHVRPGAWRLSRRASRCSTRFTDISHILFKMLGFIMYAAPLGAFGAMAFTIGRYGIRTLVQLGNLMLCFYATSALVRVRGAGGYRGLHGFRIWRLLKYLKEELLIVLGTSTSEAALPADD